MCPSPQLPALHRMGLYLPVSVIGEDLIAGQVQLVPLQQQLQLPIPVIPVMLVGAESCRGGTTSGKDQAHLSSLLLTRPGQDSFQVSFPKLMHICLTGVGGCWRLRDIFMVQDRPQRSCQEHLITKISTVHPSGSSVSCTLYTEILQDSQWGPTSIPKALKKAFPITWFGSCPH